MNENLSVITISREYGAYGRTYAKALSEILNIPWYDKDLVKKAAQDSGYSEEIVSSESEVLGKGTKVLNKIMNSAVTFTSSHDGIYQAQKQAILDLAKSPCIIVGRCANIILQEAGIPSFDIFLYGTLENRMARITELGENKDQDLQKFVEHIDELRQTYYKNYTKHTLGDYHDYDVLINTSIGSVDVNVKYLVDQYKELNK